MEILIKSLSHRFSGYGHFRITIDFEGKEIGTTTNNTLAIDAAFDDSYDREEGGYYKSQREAQEALVNEILRANDIEL